MKTDCANCEDGTVLSNFEETDWKHYRLWNGKDLITQECREEGCKCRNPEPKQEAD